MARARFAAFACLLALALAAPGDLDVTDPAGDEAARLVASPVPDCDAPGPTSSASTSGRTPATSSPPWTSTT